jgi:hypothetical protein
MSRLAELARALSGRHVAVVGDVMLHHADEQRFELLRGGANAFVTAADSLQ